MKLPKVEVLMIFIFLGCVAVWAVSKCNSQRDRYTRRERLTEAEDRPVRRDTVYMTPQNPAPEQPAATRQNTPTNPTPVNLKSPEKQAAPPAQTPSNPAASGSTLYCLVEGLNVRSEPNVRSKVVATLKKDEAVSFLNQKTEFTEELNLGNGKVTDHWVKIKTKSGKTGWVFGAGVHYYKK